MLDPEVPVVSVRDLGIVRDVIEPTATASTVVVTPTYSGCPATEVIEQSIVAALEAEGLGPVRVEMRRAPAWTTDWISAEGPAQAARLRHRAARPGAAPASAPMRFVPRRRRGRSPARAARACDTERISAFGSTACKALYRCRACGEPFEHFKPI